MAHTHLHIRVGLQVVEDPDTGERAVLWEVGDRDQPDAMGVATAPQVEPGEVDPWT
jgi:hypothetical protein